MYGTEKHASVPWHPLECLEARDGLMPWHFSEIGKMPRLLPSMCTWGASPLLIIIAIAAYLKTPCGRCALTCWDAARYPMCGGPYFTNVSKILNKSFFFWNQVPYRVLRKRAGRKKNRPKVVTPLFAIAVRRARVFLSVSLSLIETKPVIFFHFVFLLRIH